MKQHVCGVTHCLMAETDKVLDCKCPDNCPLVMLDLDLFSLTTSSKIQIEKLKHEITALETAMNKITRRVSTHESVATKEREETAKEIDELRQEYHSDRADMLIMVEKLRKTVGVQADQIMEIQERVDK